eukprot:763138-Hanusia_phi.AAC.5
MPCDDCTDEGGGGGGGGGGGLFGLGSLEKTLDPLVSSKTPPPIEEEEWPSLESLLGNGGQLEALYAEAGKVIERVTGDRVVQERKDAMSRKETMHKDKEEFRMWMARSRPSIFGRPSSLCE